MKIDYVYSTQGLYKICMKDEEASFYITQEYNPSTQKVEIKYAQTGKDYSNKPVSESTKRILNEALNLVERGFNFSSITYDVSKEILSIDDFVENEFNIKKDVYEVYLEIVDAQKLLDTRRYFRNRYGGASLDSEDKK